MDIEEEIAQRIDKELDGDCGYGVGEHLAAALMPLFRRAQAEEVREAAIELDKSASDLDPNHEAELSYINCTRLDANILRRRADRIEQEVEHD